MMLYVRLFWREFHVLLLILLRKKEWEERLYRGNTGEVRRTNLPGYIKRLRKGWT